MKFSDLFYLGKELSPYEQQKLQGEMFMLKFPAISQNRMRLWKGSHKDHLTETKFLLGVCPSWNFYDLYLLDCINKALKELDSDENFEVLDIDSFSGLNEIQKIFGDIESKQPPILVIWKEDVLLNSFWGWDAINFLMHKYKFIWSPPERTYLR